VPQLISLGEDVKQNTFLLLNWRAKYGVST
jgi:hypothetical protein